MVWGLICVLFCSSARPKSPLLRHPIKYMGESSRAKNLCFAEKFGALLIHMISWDGRARKCNFCRPSSLTQISSRRKICEKDVYSHTDYSPFLGPSTISRWDVFFLWGIPQIRISLHHAWISRKTVFLRKVVDLSNPTKYLWWFWGSFARFCWFSRRHPQL